MKRLVGSFAACAVLLFALVTAVLPVSAEFEGYQLPDGTRVCRDPATGAQYPSAYAGVSDTTKFCRGGNSRWAWLIGAAQAANYRIAVSAITARQDGGIDTSCLDGSCAPGVATLTCADSAVVYPSLSGLVKNTDAIAENVRTRFSGTAAATATLTIVSAGGTDPAVAGWTISSAGAGNNLVNAGNDADLPASGSFFIRGTTAGVSADCRVRNWSYVSGGGSDITGPSPVTNLNLVSVTSTTVTLNHDSTDDPNDAAVRSGVASYEYYRNGTLYQSVAAASAGLVNDLNWAVLGSCTGTPANSQTGAQWTLTGCGAGLEGAADNIYVGKKQVSIGAAGVTIRTRITAQSAADTSKVSLYLAAADAANSIAADCTNVLAANGIMLSNSRNRQTTGGTRASDGAVAAQISAAFAAVEYMLHYDSGGLDCAYNLDGGPWVYFVRDFAISIPSTAYAGVAVTPTSAGAGATNTATLQYISITDTSSVTQTLTAVPAGAANWTVFGKDVTGNLSTARAAVSATPSSGSSTATRTQPGYYAVYNSTLAKGKPAATLSQVLSSVSEVCAHANIKGFMIRALPNYFEGDTLGNYTGDTGTGGGFAAIDAVINALANCSTGRKYLVLVSTPSLYFGGTTPADWTPNGVDWSIVYQKYLLPTTHGGTDAAGTFGGGAIPNTQSSQGGLTLLYSNTNVKNRLIAMSQAYCSRYDSNPSFYGFSPVWDTSLPMDANTAYNPFLTALEDITTATRSACPTENVPLAVTYTRTTDQVGPLLAFLDGIDAVNDPTDTVLTEESWGQSGFVGDAGFGGVDYRGHARFWAEVEPPDMCGGKWGSNSPSSLFNRLRNGNGGTIRALWPTHIFVYMAAECDSAGTGWAAWKTFIDADGSVMNGRDSTLRSPATVKTSWCEDHLICD